MRILLDTNIIILRENNHTVPNNVSQMMQLINGLETCSIHVHPLSLDEIKKDKNIERKNINLSKISSYSVLDTVPDYQKDIDFIKIVGNNKSDNDFVDNQLLYCAYKNVVDYFITEDQELLNKADLLGLERVVNSNEAIQIFEQFYPKTDINLLQSFIKDKAFNFDLSDDIFDSLKNEYKEFPDWWKKVANRDVYAYKNDEGKINALLIPKIEVNETIDCNPVLKFKKILKICLFKVANHAQGLKLGERLLKMALDYAISNNINDIYLTHFCKEKDYLVYLIERFGFYKCGENQRGEGVFLKKITLENKDIQQYSIDEINKKYYPSFYDGIKVRKHIVPIYPEFHDKLFPDYQKNVQQTHLFYETNSEGNCIKKAYICNANTTKISKGDILLFYRTHDVMALTTLGVVESVYYKLRDPNEVLKLIAKRTVFSFDEISEICNSDVLVILFNQNFHLTSEYSYNELSKNKIISGPIQTITEISNEDYNKIIKGRVDERFIIN